MVIWPKTISESDEGWILVCALLQVLALDPRQPSTRGYKPRQYFESADDFLLRPLIWVDRQRVLAPYYSFCVRFNVSASAHGRIDVDASDQLAEFRCRINAALRGPLTVAARKQWEAETEFRKCCASNSPATEQFAAVGKAEANKADQYYNQVRETIEASRRNTGFVAASLCRHEEVLQGLACIGTTLLKAA